MMKNNKLPTSLPLSYGFVMMNNHVEMRQVLISNNESKVFEKCLNSANNKDADIRIDHKAKNEPYQLVYGSIMCTFEDMLEKQFIMDVKNNAMISLDVQKYGELSASYLADIRLFGNTILLDDFANATPFVALMQTTCEQESNSITMFPLLENMTVWESMVNRDFLFACKEFVKVDGLTKENWEEYIDMDIMKKAFALSTLRFE